MNGIARVGQLGRYIEVNLDVYSLRYFERFFIEKTVKCHYQDKTLKGKYTYYVMRMKDGLGMLFLALVLN